MIYCYVEQWFKGHLQEILLIALQNRYNSLHIQQQNWKALGLFISISSLKIFRLLLFYYFWVLLVYFIILWLWICLMFLCCFCEIYMVHYLPFFKIWLFALLTHFKAFSLGILYIIDRNFSLLYSLNVNSSTDLHFIFSKFLIIDIV